MSTKGVRCATLIPIEITSHFSTLLTTISNNFSVNLDENTLCTIVLVNITPLR